MSHNPYATPNSDLIATPASATHLYSPAQAACGALLGGPVGLIYFLRANFKALGNERLEKNTLIYGCILVVALVVALPLLPDKFPSAPFTVGYVVAARQIAEKFQMTKQAILNSSQYGFHSNWRVFGIGLLTLVGSAVVVAGPLLILHFMGVTI